MRIAQISVCVLMLASCDAQQAAQISGTEDAEGYFQFIANIQLPDLELSMRSVDDSLIRMRDSHSDDSEMRAVACDSRYVLTDRHERLRRELGETQPEVYDPRRIYESFCGPHRHLPRAGAGTGF